MNRQRPRSRTKRNFLVRNKLSPVRPTIVLQEGSAGGPITLNDSTDEIIQFDPYSKSLSLSHRVSIHQRDATVNGSPNPMLLREMEKMDSEF
jgi:hypothetical protein